jgi:general secretion pathway protein A
MYHEFYGLSRSPFHVTPDPSCLFLTNGHKDSVGAILYGIEARKGFIAVTGDAGVGKTTALRYCLEHLDRETYELAYLFQPALAPREFYAVLYRELFGRSPLGGYGVDMEVSAIVEAIHKRLLSLFDQGKSVVVVIDEAQNMPIETLESLRVLSNLETDREKLLQIVLVGQTELENKLLRHELRQLDQRIAVRARIPALTTIQAVQYIEYKVELAGGVAADIFTNSAGWILISAARGNPRRLNMYCDNALMNGYGYGIRRVNAHVAWEAVQPFRRAGLWGLFGAIPRYCRTAIAAAVPVLWGVAVARMTGKIPIRDGNHVEQGI